MLKKCQSELELERVSFDSRSECPKSVRLVIKLLKLRYLAKIFLLTHLQQFKLNGMVLTDSGTFQLIDFHSVFIAVVQEYSKCRLLIDIGWFNFLMNYLLFIKYIYQEPNFCISNILSFSQRGLLCVKACSVTQSCPTPCDPMDCTPPSSFVHGIFQAGILEWVVISFSRGSS